MHKSNYIDQESTIFVTIAACQEYFIEHTIKSAISLAANSDRVFFGVFNNILDKSKSLIEKDFFINNPNVMYAELITNVSMGVGFGRMNASLLSTRKHDYVLQIDSHTVFTKNWDLELIKNFKNISETENSNKTILTGITRGNLYYNTNDRDTLMSDDDVFVENNIHKIDIYNNNYHEFSELPYPYHNTKPQIKFDGWQGNNFKESMVGFPITYGTHEFKEESYAEVNCIHASLVFFKYETIREIIHDPEDFFHGDQVNYALRLLSRGYRIFAIKKPLLLTLDKYSQNKSFKGDEATLIDHEWNWRASSPSGQSANDYIKRLQDISLENYEKIFNGKYLGYWGAPDDESLKIAKEKMGFKIT